MAYVGFDLDETLGRFSVAHLYSLFLEPHNVVYKGSSSGLYGSEYDPEPIPLSSALKEQLGNAFTIFAKCLAEKEKSNPPLGLLRPSMIDLIKRLKVLKEEGAVKAVVIYSNNGNIALLHLAGQMLEQIANAPGLFCNYIHWYHPSRSEEVTFGHPGKASKHLDTLKKAFQTGLCSATEINENDIYFFDDINPPHSDLYTKLGERYIRLVPYKYDAIYQPLDECFVKALRESGLLENQEYFEYISKLIGRDKNLQGILAVINYDKIGYQRRTMKPDDTDLSIRTHRIFPKRTSRENFTRALQTLRKLEKKQNVGNTLNESEKESFEAAKTIVSSYEDEHPNMQGGKQSGVSKQSSVSKRRRSVDKQSSVSKQSGMGKRSGIGKRSRKTKHRSHKVSKRYTRKKSQ